MQIDDILQILYKEFGDDLKCAENRPRNTSKAEDEAYEKLENSLNDEQKKLFEDFWLEFCTTEYDEYCLRFASGLKLGFKLALYIK